jgi:gamma-glutamyl:cysteine ligase YbdK (ATP-grasp superfamily)
MADGTKMSTGWVPGINPVVGANDARAAEGLETLRQLLEIFDERGQQVRDLLEEREQLQARVKELEDELAPDME